MEINTCSDVGNGLGTSVLNQQTNPFNPNAPTWLLCLDFSGANIVFLCALFICVATVSFLMFALQGQENLNSYT